nr:DUF4221 family protein [Algoriphagus locisalis]
MEYNKDLKYTLVADGDIDFDLDDESSMFMSHIQYYDFKEGKIFTFLNQFNNSIYIYDVENNSFVESIPFDIEGPQGVGKIQGYSFLDRNTISLIDTYRYKAIIFDISNKEFLSKKKELLFTSGKINSSNGFSTELDASIPWMSTYAPVIFGRQSNLWISALPESSSKSTYESSINVFHIDKNDSLSKLSFFPPNMLGFHWEDGEMPRMASNLDSSGVVVSYKYSNSIGVVDAENLKVTFTNPLGEFKETKLVFREYPTSMESNERYINSYTVYALLSDPYRNVYYRIIEEPNFIEIEKDGERKDSKRPIVQILDQDFILIGEVSLPNYEYLYNMCFVSEEGLMISQPKMDFKKMTIDENTLRFVVFKLKAIK